MKRLVTAFLLICIFTAMFALSALAKSGDVIGYAKYTDIAAYINHYPITSYNINNYTAIVAEDLQNYGFNVVWNGDEHSLSVTRNDNATAISPQGTVYKYTAKAGQNSFAYLETNIVTYVDGKKVDSFNINGRTCIYIDSLAPYGKVEWVPEVKAIKLWVDGLPTKAYEPIEEAPMTTLYAPDGRTKVVENSEVEANLKVGWYSSLEKAEAAKRYSDPRYASTIQILKDCERHVSLASACAGTLSSRVDLYRMNPSRYYSYLVSMQEDINNIDSWVSKVRSLTENDRRLYPLYICTDIDYVVVNSSKLSKVVTYAYEVEALKASYDSMCEWYGIPR